MRLADLPEVRALPARKKLRLLDELWQDVARDLDSLEVSEMEKRLLDERWTAYLGDPGAALTQGQFKKRLRTLRR
jgi:putative addiction module component (TIGR02574 family)